MYTYIYVIILCWCHHTESFSLLFSLIISVSLAKKAMTGFVLLNSMDDLKLIDSKSSLELANEKRFFSHSRKVLLQLIH